MSRPTLRFKRSRAVRGREDVLLHLAASAPAARKSARRARRRAAPPRRRWTREGAPRSWVRPAIGFLVFVEVLLLGAHAIQWARTSDRFVLREVVVEGYRTLDPKALVRLTKLEPGMNIFDADLDAIRRRVERNPWVRRASVRLRPPHVLLVEIEERRPAVLLRRQGAIGADADGVVLGPLPKRTAGCLPLIEGYDAGRLRPGDRIRGRGFDVAVQAASLFASAPVVKEGCLTVRPPREGRLRLSALGGRVELLVDEDRMAAQAARFGVIARHMFRKANASNARVEVDLTFPGRVIVRSLSQDGGTRG